MKYQLIIETGTIKEEIGNFFKSLPFTVHYAETKQLEIKFEHGSTGKVVFKIIQDQKVLAECPHPDYAPESKPGTLEPPTSLATPLQYAMSAFAHLNIIKDKTYLEQFHPVTGELKLSFRLTQKI